MIHSKHCNCKDCNPIPNQQPPACPSCCHPMSEHDSKDGWCHHIIDVGGEKTECTCVPNPADQEQPKSEMALICETCDVENPTDCVGHQCCIRQCQSDRSWLPVHDAAIRAQARREFADKVIKDAPFYFDDDLGLAITKKDLEKHIQAEGEIE